jgi:hypothetical protein
MSPLSPIAQGSSTSLPGPAIPRSSLVRRASAPSLAPPGSARSSLIDAPVGGPTAEPTVRAHLHEVLGIDREASMPTDLARRVDDTLSVLMRHGLTSPCAMDAVLSTALRHDAWVTSVVTVLANFLGYTVGLSGHALKVSPRLTDVISARGLFNGCATVTTNTLSHMVLAGSTLEQVLAVGPESDLPGSMRDRASPGARALSGAAFAFAHDLVRQSIPVLQAMSYPSQGAGVSLAVAGRDSVLMDAASRNLSACLNALRPMNAGHFLVGGLSAGEATYNERLLLQSPERLDRWLTEQQSSLGQRVSAGGMRYVKAMPSALARFGKHVPALVPQAFMGGIMISMGLIAAAGRAAERTRDMNLREGFEDRGTTLQRRMIFGFSEALLEAALVGMAPIFDQVVASQPVTDVGHWAMDRLRAVFQSSASPVASVASSVAASTAMGTLGAANRV